jgi:flagellar capping protein FliD
MQADEASYRAVMSQQVDGINKSITKLDQMDYRVTSLEKASENTDNRISRISDSYSNQFADFRTQLSSISTQIALSNQTLQRIEASRAEPSLRPRD